MEDLGDDPENAVGELTDADTESGLEKSPVGEFLEQFDSAGPGEFVAYHVGDLATESQVGASARDVRCSSSPPEHWQSADWAGGSMPPATFFCGSFDPGFDPDSFNLDSFNLGLFDFGLERTRQRRGARVRRAAPPGR